MLSLSSTLSSQVWIQRCGHYPFRGHPYPCTAAGWFWPQEHLPGPEACRWFLRPQWRIHADALRHRCGTSRGSQFAIQRSHVSLGDSVWTWATGPALDAASTGGWQPTELTSAVQLLHPPASAFKTTPSSSRLAAAPGTDSGDPSEASLGRQEITSLSRLPFWGTGPRTHQGK